MIQVTKKFAIICLLVGNSMLISAPQAISCYKEIAALYEDAVAPLFNALTPEERIFAYYIFRASLPGNRILAGQLHRHAIALIELFEELLTNKERLEESLHGIDAREFIEEITIYLVYLWTNHGNYFLKEHMNEKRTPKKLGLGLLTYENLTASLTALGKSTDTLNALKATIFDELYEPTLTVANDIEKSAVNVYGRGITNKQFDALPPHERGHINAYYAKDPAAPSGIKTHRYSIKDIFAQELEISAHWLEKAREYAVQFPALFDEHLVKSLEYAIQFFNTGDEELFKLHSIEWLQTKSRIDYTIGFIENYKDPKSMVGFFAGEVTIKAVSLDALNAMLPTIEAQLPFPAEYQRENLFDSSALPNASVNSMLFGAGDAGPLSITAAYCLPNYAEIRSQHGSKQIMYKVGKGLGQVMNPVLYRALFNAHEHVQWLNEYDPHDKLGADIWEVHCILHETLGHGSGRLAHHIFREGDPMTIGGISYRLGDRIQVTSDTIAEFLPGLIDSLEELRAEIIALYTSIFNFEELEAKGLYKDWPQKIGKEKMIECLILDMGWTGLRRLLSQPIGVREISGAHAQANTVILHYLLEKGGLALTKEEYVHEGHAHTVLGLVMKDREKALAAIKELCIEVQRIKSTADTQANEALFERYGKYVTDLAHGAILKDNLKAVVGDLKVSARIFPSLKPLYNNGKIADIEASWPHSLVEQYQDYKKIMMSKE